MTCGGSGAAFNRTGRDRRVSAGLWPRAPWPALLLPLLLLAGCGGNVLTQWSTEWVDIQPNPTPLAQAQRACREQAGAPGSSGDAFLFCMRRHGWVAMRDPLLD